MAVFRLGAVETHDGIVKQARILRQSRRAADGLQQEIAGCVVAPVDRGGAKIAEAPAALADVRPGDRRIIGEVSGAIGNYALKPFGTSLDAH
jgi:hypothetical protein